MSRWIDTKDSGPVNLDFIRRIAHRKDGTRRLIGEEGDVVGELYGSFDEESLKESIIPATTPMMALVVTWNTPDEQNPTGIYTEERLIVAWKISDMGTFPIIAGDHPSSNQDVLIIHQDGRCEELLSCTYDSREEAIESIRKKERWKRP